MKNKLFTSGYLESVSVCELQADSGMNAALPFALLGGSSNAYILYPLLQTRKALLEIERTSKCTDCT